ncbi:MAG: LruC domain-containing protein [Bacteroidales bacterium]|nr:LruC domain-containing protein [Bacteroidales bacterium]
MKKREAFNPGRVSRYLLLVFVSVGLLSGCVRNTIDDSLPAEIEGLSVPAAFNWSTVKSVELTVSPQDSYNGTYYYYVEVFNGNPVTDTTAVLLASGVANQNQDFVRTLSLPSVAEVLYVRQTDPLRMRTTQVVVVDSTQLRCDFGDTSPLTPEIPAASSRLSAARIASNPTPSGAISLATTPSAAITLDASKAYVIPAGVTYTGKITFSQGSLLYVEGSLEVTGTNIPVMASGNDLVVQENGSFTSGGGAFYAYAGRLINHGTLSVGTITLNSTATVFNSGRLTVTGAFTVTDGANSLVNEGYATLGSVSLTNGLLENNGLMTIDGQLYTNSATFRNTNSLQAHEAIMVTSRWYIDCGTYITEALSDQTNSDVYIKQGAMLKIGTFNGSGTKVRLEASAMLEAAVAVFNSNKTQIFGEGTTYALCRFGRVQAGAGSYKAIQYKGRLEVECSDHYQGLNQWNPFYETDSKVRWAEAGQATTLIVSTSCNNEGHTPIPPATVPSNPEYPIDDPTTPTYTFLMEDNWPAVADYDLNDLVAKLRFSYLQNNTNQVTGMRITYTLVAVGAKKSIAAAVQLDELMPQQIQGVVHGSSIPLNGKVFAINTVGLEEGQTKPVIPLFDQAHQVLDPAMTYNSMINTYKDSPRLTPVTNTIDITFAEPITAEKLDVTKLNFFIVPEFERSVGNRTEIHLRGFAPTDKAEKTRFGRYYDNSVNGSWYSTPGNLVWGIMVPYDFAYAAETKSIVKAYPDFSAWCTSGGLDKAYWYQNPSTDAELVY